MSDTHQQDLSYRNTYNYYTDFASCHIKIEEQYMEIVGYISEWTSGFIQVGV